ncbi:ATP-dependent helicase/nuclease subunit B [Anaerosolibacter carboniphilus]|uniref:ATP-dependent helicase/deoxyribonuclease subunit B n=1 Tax=Anaerosolibacter carboniphilus TaxID=1417629 RepID=A0A841L3F3_9FIRM|nr:helicase-exonuclease AddAB subunit AddB [Anaerosolibacter carboniphilus]MBB6217672.1 ATP-dependent helicase/nuclease subunit B [Anaerosolibacter carboniphilus]
MSIRYIFGRSGRGKTHYILEEIKARLKEDPDHKLILIVPDQFTLQAERDLIEKLKLPGILKVEVLSFTRLAHNVLNEVGGRTRVHINDQGKSMVLRKVIDAGEKQLTIYRKISQQEGFIEKFCQLLCELKQHDVKPGDLVIQGEALEEDSILRSKLQDIAYIYEQFDQSLQGNYIDTEDYMNMMADKLEQAQFLQGAEIWIDGFNSFTPQIYRILEKLMLVAKRITVSFTMDFAGRERDGDLFKISETTYGRLHEIALNLGLPGEIIDLEAMAYHDSKKPPELLHLERELYAYPYVPYPGEVKNLELFAGINLHTEIETMAAQILYLIRDKGHRWNDIAVVCGDLESYGTLIKRVFEEYEIPYFLDQKRPISNNPLILFLLSALITIQRGYRYEDIFRLLKTGFGGLSSEEYEELENYVLRYGIQGNRWKEDFDRGEVDVIESVNSWRVRLINPIEKLEKKIKGKKTVAEMTRALYDYLEEVDVHGKLQDWVEELRDKGQHEHVNENAQIWNIILDTFDQLVEILGEQRITLKEYIRILDAGFASLEVGIIPTTIDQILIGNIQRSKSHDIKALFVLGVNDGVLPSGKDEDGILAEREKLVMKEMGLVLGTDRERKAYEEKFNIYSAFSRPSEYLWLSYALADQEGKAMRPSILMDRVKKIFKGIQVKSDVVNDVQHQLHMIATKNSTFKYLVENMRLNLDGKPMEAMWWDVYEWYYGQDEWKAKREAIAEGFFHQNQVDYLGDYQAKALYQTPIRSSVSRLEQFVNCPFAHFVKYGLKPKERDYFKVEAPDIGELFHHAMEDFTKALKDSGQSWRELDKNQCDEMIDRVIDGVVPNYNHGVMFSTHRYRYLVNRLKRISRRAVWTMTEHLKRSSFEPMGYEVSFGQGGYYPPIEIELADGEKLYLEGRIDRVDILEEDEACYIKIMDYKSGKKDFSLSNVYHGFELQLMIYLDAVLSHHGNTNKKNTIPAGVFYFRIDDPLVKTDEKIAETIEKEIRRRLKLKGLALRDVRIVRELDREIDGHSDIIPVAVSKNGEFYKNSSAIDGEAFTALIGHVRGLVKEITYEMMKGNVRIAPSKNNKQVACEFCSYKGICQFDNLLEDNQYRNIEKLSDEEVMKRMAPRRGEVDGDGKVD